MARDTSVVFSDMYIHIALSEARVSTMKERNEDLSHDASLLHLYVDAPRGTRNGSSDGSPPLFLMPHLARSSKVA